MGADDATGKGLDARWRTCALKKWPCDRGVRENAFTNGSASGPALSPMKTTWTRMTKMAVKSVITMPPVPVGAHDVSGIAVNVNAIRKKRKQSS